MEENGKELPGQETTCTEEPEKKKAKRKFRDNPVIGTILLFVAAFLIISFGGALGEPAEYLIALTGDEALMFAGGYLAFIGIWVLGLLVMLKKKNRPMFRAMGKEAKGNRIGTVLLLGLLLGFAYNMVMALLAMANGDIRLVFGEFNLYYFLIFLVCVGIQSGAEELICRLYVYQKLRKIWPQAPAVAIFGNALFFSLLHLGNDGVTALAILDITVCGVMYSLVVYYFDSFWACVVAHTTWNFTQNILLGLPNSGIISQYSVFKLDAANAADSPFYNVAFGIEGSLVTVLLGVVICILLFVTGRKRGQKPLDVWKTEEP